MLSWKVLNEGGFVVSSGNLLSLSDGFRGSGAELLFLWELQSGEVVGQRRGGGRLVFVGPTLSGLRSWIGSGKKARLFPMPAFVLSNGISSYS